MQYYADDFRTPQDVREFFRPLNGFMDIRKIERLARQMFIFGNEPEGLEARNHLLEYKRKAQAILATAQKPALPLPPIERVRAYQIRGGTYTQLGRRFFPFSLPVAGLAHSLIIGQPGKGKTTLMLNLSQEIERLNEAKGHQSRIGQVIVDRSRDFRNCKYPKLVIDMKRLRNFNPFDGPPMMPWSSWLPSVCDWLASNWKVLRASRDRLIDYAKAFYDSTGKVPTPEDMLASMESDRLRNHSSERDAELYSVAKDRLKSMINAFPGCASRKSFPFHEVLLSGSNCVFEMNDFDNDSYSFAVGWLLLYTFAMNRYLGIRGNLTFENGGTAFFFDEAHLLWEPGRERQYTRVENGIGFLEAAPLWIRGARMSMICATQVVPSLELFTAANNVIVGSVRDYDQAQYLAKSVGDPSLVSVIPNLERGEWIVKVGDLPVSAVITEDYPLPDKARISDEEIDQSMQGMHQYFEESSKEPEESREAERETLHLSSDARKLLFHIWKYPDWSISRRWRDKGLGFSNGNKQRELVEEISKAGYAVRTEIKVGTRRQVFLVLTEKATSWLKQAQKNCDHIAVLSAAGQGPEHAAYQQLLVSCLRNRKFNVWQNKFVPDDPSRGKLLDVWAESSEKRIGFEIAMSGDVDTPRFSALLASSIPDEVLFLVKDLEVENSLRRQLAGVDLRKVRFVMASNYISDLLTANLSYYTDNPDSDDTPSKSAPLAKSDGEPADNSQSGPDDGPTKPKTSRQGGPK